MPLGDLNHLDLIFFSPVPHSFFLFCPVLLEILSKLVVHSTILKSLQVSWTFYCVTLSHTTLSCAMYEALYDYILRYFNSHFLLKRFFQVGISFPPFHVPRFFLPFLFFHSHLLQCNFYKCSQIGIYFPTKFPTLVSSRSSWVSTLFTTWELINEPFRDLLQMSSLFLLKYIIDFYILHFTQKPEEQNNWNSFLSKLFVTILFK